MNFIKVSITKGLLHLTASLSYKALPNILGSIGIPYIGFIYSASIAGYTTLSNIYSLITELNDKNAQSKYYAAYNNLYKALSTSFLNKFYDFESKYQAHQKQELELNHKNFKTEEAHFKALVEAKGEFGYELYNYVYEPYLNQKYKLLNEFIKVDLSKEEKDKLIPVLKHDITINGQHYDACASQYDNKYSDYSTVLSCYDEQQQIIHRIYPSVIEKQIFINAPDFPID